MKWENILIQVIFFDYAMIFTVIVVCLAGDYAAAKESLARMKYFVNIDELLKETLDLPP